MRYITTRIRPQQSVTNDIVVLIQADASGNSMLAQDLIDAFAQELERSDGIRITTDNGSHQKAAYRVSIQFIPVVDCHGVIWAELFDSDGHPVWQDHKVCYDFPSGELLQNASKELVAGLLSRLKSTTHNVDSEVQ